MIILRLLLLLTNLHLKLLSTQGTGADKLLSTQRVNIYTRDNLKAVLERSQRSLDGRQCGNNLALCNFAAVMELPDSV